jgi:1,4-alpha-glucan branching enzyme
MTTFRDLEAVKTALYAKYDGDAFKRVVYTESHDEVANGKARVPEEIWPGNSHHWFAKKRSTMGAVLVFTAPGIPMIFQGQEFLEDKWFDRHRAAGLGTRQGDGGHHLPLPRSDATAAQLPRREQRTDRAAHRCLSR